MDYVTSIPEDEKTDVFELLIRCIQLIGEKKPSKAFFSFEGTEIEKSPMIDTPIDLEGIIFKLRNREYRNILEIEEDIKLILQNIEKLYGNSSQIMTDAKSMHKWFKKIVGGMFCDLYKDVD